MMGYNAIKRIGEGNYLNEDSFIIERARKVKTLKLHHSELVNSKPKTQTIAKNERKNSA